MAQEGRRTGLSRSGRIAWLGCLAAVLFTGAAGAATSAQKAGFVLLREGVGARAEAMGEAYTAVSGDQTAAFWNPAGVATMAGKDFVLAHNQSFLGIQQTYAGWAYGNGRRGLALSAGVHSVGGLETRTGPSAEPLGTFDLYDLYAGLSYAQRIGARFYGGASVRALYESIGAEGASGVSVDLGVLYRTPVKGVMLGAAFRNWGRTSALDVERVPLPRTFRVGAALVRGPVTAAVDFRLPEYGERGINVGAEYEIRHALFLRAGYLSGSQTRDISFGVGLQRRNWRVDYAYVPAHLGLSGSHRVTLGIR